MDRGVKGRLLSIRLVGNLRGNDELVGGLPFQADPPSILRVVRRHSKLIASFD